MKIESGGKKKRHFLKVAGLCIIAAAVFFLIVIAYQVNSSRSQSYKESEKIIDKYVALQLNKYPDELTDEDFESVKTLELDDLVVLSTLKPLHKLTNLETLFAACLKKTSDESANWLNKLRAFLKLPALQETTTFDIDPIGKLKNLKVLDLDLKTEYIKPLTKLKDLEFLHINLTAVKDTEQLSRLKNVKQLYFVTKEKTETHFLKSLENLETLDITSDLMLDFEPLQSLENLHKLTFTSDTSEADLEEFSRLSALKTLELRLPDAALKNAPSLVNLTGLQELVLPCRNIKDISILEKLANLNRLDLYYGREIEDFTPLSKLTKLKFLSLRFCPVKDLSFLKNLNLEDLDLFGTQVYDISPLINQHNLEKLSLCNTGIIGISSLATLYNLKEIDLSQTQVNDIGPLERLDNLISLNLSHTQVRDISPLAGLERLEYLNLSNTQIMDLSPIAGLSNLAELNVTQTIISDIKVEKVPENILNIDLYKKQVLDEDIAELKKALPRLNIFN